METNGWNDALPYLAYLAEARRATSANRQMSSSSEALGEDVYHEMQHLSFLAYSRDQNRKMLLMLSAILSLTGYGIYATVIRPTRTEGSPPRP